MQTARINHTSFTSEMIEPGATKHILVRIPFSTQSPLESLTTCRLELDVRTSLYFQLVGVFAGETSILPNRTVGESSTVVDVLRTPFRRYSPDGNSVRKLWVVVRNGADRPHRARGKFHFTVDDAAELSKDAPQRPPSPEPSPEPSGRRGILSRVSGALLWSVRAVARLADEYDEFVRALAVGQVEPGEDSLDVGDLTVVPVVPAVVGAGEVMTFSTASTVRRILKPLEAPGESFRVRRLIIDRKVASHFYVRDLVSGGVSLVDFAGDREVPAAMFALGELTDLDGPPSARDDVVTLTVRNATHTSQLFWAKLLCSVEPTAKKETP